MALKLVFMGTPDFSVPALAALAAAGHEIRAVYSQPPRPAGRGMAERPSPVHAKANALGIPVRTPLSLKGAHEQQAFASLEADAAVVIAYGLILPHAVLAAPRFGCFNVHAWHPACDLPKAERSGGGCPRRIVMNGETTVRGHGASGPLLPSPPSVLIPLRGPVHPPRCPGFFRTEHLPEA